MSLLKRWDVANVLNRTSDSFNLLLLKKIPIAMTTLVLGLRNDVTRGLRVDA